LAEVIEHHRRQGTDLCLATLSPCASLARGQMYSLSSNGSKFRKFIAEYSGIISTTPVVFLIVAGLAALVMFSISSCSAPKPTPPPLHVRSVTLKEPENGSYLAYGPEVMLRWSFPRVLQPAEYYRVMVRVKGQVFAVFYPTKQYYSLSLAPGDYSWTVTVMRFIGQDEYKPVSEESESYGFKIAPPSPVVRSISPAGAPRGIGVPVVISGENFTHPLTLTIGVPLSATFVSSSTIKATIPITLAVGEYPVIVKDMVDGGTSFASFRVYEPPSPTPSVVLTSAPGVTPTLTLTRYPAPTLTPTPYPPPTLTMNGIIERNVTFGWDWPGVLAEDEWFAVRVGKLPDIPHSQSWRKEREYVYSLCTLGGEPGDYVWEVAICRGEPTTTVCNQLTVSERGAFSFGGWPSCD